MKIMLWEMRTARGYSTRELAERSGISKTTINDIENNKVSPTIITLEALAAALECSFYELLKE